MLPAPYVSPSFPPPCRHGIDCWITNPLPESIKSLHRIDLAQGREWKWGQEGPSNRTLKSIDGFLTLWGRRCQSSSIVCRETRGKNRFVGRRSRQHNLLQTDYAECLASVY